MALECALTNEDPRIHVWNRLWEKVSQLFGSPDTCDEASKLGSLLARWKPARAPLPEGAGLLYRYKTLKKQGLEPGSEETEGAKECERRLLESQRNLQRLNNGLGGEQ